MRTYPISMCRLGSGVEIRVLWPIALASPARRVISVGYLAGLASWLHQIYSRVHCTPLSPQPCATAAAISPGQQPCKGRKGAARRAGLGPVPTQP